MVREDEDEMSESNYGEKNLKIRIPIEIIPQESGIREKITEIKDRERLDRQATSQEKLAPRRVPQGKSAPIDLIRDEEQKKFLKFMKTLAVGVAPTAPKLGWPSNANEITQKVPRGGDRPDEFIKKVRNPDAGLHIYGEDDAPGTIEKVIGKVLGGPAKAQEAMSMLKNPIKLVKFLGPVAIPIIAALVAVEVTKRIIRELVRKGSIYDRTFKNVVDNRVEALRTREQQQKYLIGFGDTAQLITTTSAGTTNPRDAYNTYEQFNNNNVELEEKFAIRNDSGYD